MVLFPFCRRVGGGQRGCQPAKYMSIFTSMPLSGKHTCAGAKKSSDLPSTLCQPDVIVSLVYARGDGSTCVILDAFFFFSDPSPLHYTEDFLFMSLPRWDTHTSPRLQALEIQNEEKIGFYGTLANELIRVQRHRSVWSVWNSTNKERKRV